jgi:hypothetical protein
MGNIFQELFGGSSAKKVQGGADAQARMAQDMYNSSKPIRDPLIQRYSDFVGGNLDPTANPIYNPAFTNMKRANEEQYGIARQNLLDTLPTGGVLQSQLGNLEMQRAQGMEGGLNDLVQRIIGDEYGKAYGMATNSPQIAGQLYQGAQSGYNTMGMMGSNQAVMNTALLGDIGMGLATK